MKKEIKIKEIINTGNEYEISFVCNEGYFESYVDEFGETLERFVRTLLHEFSVQWDVVPKTTKEITDVAIELMILEYGYKKEDFIN